jgi:hypothetical protein
MRVGRQSRSIIDMPRYCHLVFDPRRTVALLWGRLRPCRRRDFGPLSAVESVATPVTNSVAFAKGMRASVQHTDARRSTRGDRTPIERFLRGLVDCVKVSLESLELGAKSCWLRFH